MDIEAAKKFLEGSKRHELQDHAFGDSEVYWVKDGKEVATGYFGGDSSEFFFADEKLGGFVGEDARALRDCGELGDVERNDETGPETYAEGQTMPGLSLGDVREELTGG